jgi:cytochrome P450
MDTSPAAGEPITDEWIVDHFDYLSAAYARDLHGTLARMRHGCPIAYSDQHGGYWIATKYDDVLRIAQDWQTYSSELGVGIPSDHITVRAIPEHIDPPLHREYKRLINAYFTPTVVARCEADTRAIVTALIDAFVDRGECDFMKELATPFPGLAFFQLVLNAPHDRVVELSALSAGATIPGNPDAKACWDGLTSWIDEFLTDRRRAPRQDDVVDAILHAEIEGRPITDAEVMGMVLLLILGGLETTAGALGHFMIRFCREPEIPALLRRQPELVPAAVEELLRLEGPFIAVGRTVRADTELDGRPVKAGEKVMVSWASANRDEEEFACPDEFRLDRPRNRHIAFGAGPHRCAGSNLARLILAVAVEEIVQRLDDLELAIQEDDIQYHHAFNRSPLSLPLRFTARERTPT